MSKERNGHITDPEWTRFWQDQMTPEEQDALLSHACGCDWCSNRMAGSLPEEQKLPAPAYFKEETVVYIRKHTRFSRFLGTHRFQLAVYCMKVGLAAACALFLVLRFPLSPSERNAQPHIPSVSQEEADGGFHLSFSGVLNYGTNFINRKLYEFSDQLLNTNLLPDNFDKEVSNHEK